MINFSWKIQFWLVKMLRFFHAVLKKKWNFGPIIIYLKCISILDVPQNYLKNLKINGGTLILFLLVTGLPWFQGKNTNTVTLPVYRDQTPFKIVL